MGSEEIHHARHQPASGREHLVDGRCAADKTEADQEVLPVARGRYGEIEGSPAMPDSVCPPGPRD